MNSELYDKKYPVPLPIIAKLKSQLMGNDPTGEGVKRAKFLIKNGYATYQMLKRIKNFFDNFDQTSDSLQEYELSGGNDMRNYIEHTLEADRSSYNTSKSVKRPLSMGESTMKMKIMEAEEKEVSSDTENLTKNALAVIYNDENRVLLLKRSSYPDQWMPNKWALVGGGVEDGEEPIAGCAREIKEETGLVIKNLLERAVLQRNPDSVEHIFVAKYEGDPFNIKLDEENQGYGWFGKNEIDFLDVVPNLMDYINIAIKNYD